jgi:hypothetical protein
VNGRAAGSPGDGWRAAVPEICIAAAVVAVAAVAAYAAGGLPGAAVAVICAAVAALVVLRVLAPPRDRGAPGDSRPADTEGFPATFSGYWRKRAGLVDGTQSMTAYDAELRGILQHLLAARLAERHGISLQDDPEAARRLLCPGPRDAGLWYWVDPARPAAAAGAEGAAGGRGAAGRRAAGGPGAGGWRRRSGIPRRALAQLIDRLEQL